MPVLLKAAVPCTVNYGIGLQMMVVRDTSDINRVSSDDNNFEEH